jgi:hypothetical protein
MSKVTGNNAKGTLYCSFCGKSQHEVRKLIAGPKAERYHNDGEYVSAGWAAVGGRRRTIRRHNSPNGITRFPIRVP